MVNRKFIVLRFAKLKSFNSRLWYIGLVSLKDSIMVLGGRCDLAAFTTQIAKYTINEWSYVGNLLHIRDSHRAILIGHQIHVIGGYGHRGFQLVKL